MDDRETEFSIFDDSGLLSLVDCAAYPSFLSEDWTYETIVEHFNKQMGRRSILVWECGDGGGPYSISVRMGLTERSGFREATGSIVSTTDRLHLVSYDALTMAAQYEDQKLPDKREAAFAIPLKAGQYKVRVVQSFDPKQISKELSPQFLIEMEPGDAPVWKSPAWLHA